MWIGIWKQNNYLSISSVYQSYSTLGNGFLKELHKNRIIFSHSKQNVYFCAIFPAWYHNVVLYLLLYRKFHDSEECVDYDHNVSIYQDSPWPSLTANRSILAATCSGSAQSICKKIAFAFSLNTF